MISSSCWVPRGFASEFPEKYELDDAEMDRINAMAKLELNDAKEDLANAEAGADDDENDDDDEKADEKPIQLKEQLEVDDDLKEYDLEHYDDDDEKEGEAITMFPGLAKSDAKFHQDDGENEAYLSLPNETDLTEEKEESQIYPTDNLVLATRTEDDISYLDVYVYDDGAGAPEGANEEEEDKLDEDVAKGLIRGSNLYVHHDLMLPSFPLCVEWINYKPGQTNIEEGNDNIGNFAAVGTFDPQIEIWNLDCIDKAFPDLILGEPQQNSFNGLSKNKKKKKKSKTVSTHHTDAVLSLTHNRTHRNVLASTSADKTVKLWDLNNGTAVRSLNTIHNNKTVSSSQWHSQEASILLTGGYDGTCGLTDVRISDSNQMTKNYKVSAGEEIENVKWGHNSAPEIFYAGTDNGNVYCFDVRSTDKPVWTLHAHDAGISSLDVNAHIPGMITTSAMNEKTVKLWKCPISSKNGPSMVLSRDFGVGNVLSSSFAGDIEVAGNVTVGGVSGSLKLWDAFSNRSVRSSFRDELRDLQKSAREYAKQQGRASRIARKYQSDQHNENILTVEAGSLEDDSESDGEDYNNDMEEDNEEDV